jgi:hypothetical protein
MAMMRHSQLGGHFFNGGGDASMFNSRSMSGFGVRDSRLFDARMEVGDQPLLVGDKGFRDVRAEPLLVDDRLLVSDDCLVEPTHGLGGGESLDWPVGHDTGVAHFAFAATEDGLIY